jgi:DNA-binding response OmpR family regulator
LHPNHLPLAADADLGIPSIDRASSTLVQAQQSIVIGDISYHKEALMESIATVRQRVLLVESNTAVAEQIALHLRREAFDVVVAAECAEALQVIARCQPAIILLAAQLDDGAGVDLCRTIRSGGPNGTLRRLADTPLLMLAARADEHDRVAGFQAGADDYLTRPLSLPELVCRMRAIIWRNRGLSHALIEIGALRIDPRRYEAIAGDQALDLSPKEFELLYAMACQPGIVFSREDLIAQVWGFSYLGNSRTIDMHVSRLRQKLAVHQLCRCQITTEWRVGYKLVATEAPQRAAA